MSARRCNLCIFNDMKKNTPMSKKIITRPSVLGTAVYRVDKELNDADLKIAELDSYYIGEFMEIPEACICRA